MKQTIIEQKWRKYQNLERDQNWNNSLQSAKVSGAAAEGGRGQLSPPINSRLKICFQKYKIRGWNPQFKGISAQN